MTFGNDETFALIEKALFQSEAAGYDDVLSIVYKDAKTIVNQNCRNICKADREDILQEVVLTVFKRLSQFYQESQNYSPAQRNSWLRTVISSKTRDFLRAQKRQIEASVFVDEMRPDLDNRIEKKYIMRDELLTSLQKVFQIQTTAQKLLAFVYNRLLYRTASDNGSPQSIIATFQGKRIIDIYECMVSDLSHFLQCEIPVDYLEPLRRKIEGCPNEIFCLSPRTITDSSNWIAKKLKELRDDEN
jgi:DNA-directed RNA polymerase specialized sigma24 family protein